MGDQLHVPVGWEQWAERKLAPLNTNAVEHSPEYRRMITASDCLLFALTYLPHHLRSAETGGRLSLCPFHVDTAARALQWARDDLGPDAAPHEAEIAPRGCGKTSWAFLIRPLWALAHGHKSFVQVITSTGGKAAQHLSTLKRELLTNARLRQDYPELCTPGRLGGRSDTDTKAQYVAQSGVTIAAGGIGSALLGAKHGNVRPDALIVDDIEQDEGHYSAGTKASHLDTLQQAVFDMNPDAAVLLAGTTTAYGSLMHELVRSATGGDTADWIAERRVRAYYYPAILRDKAGVESALWPQRWSIEWLQAQRKFRWFWANYMNMPLSADGGFWVPADLRYGDGRDVAWRGLWLDPAVTSGPRADYTGVAVVGRNHRRDAVVEHSQQIRVAPAGMRSVMLGLLGVPVDPPITDVFVEVVQGGEAIPEVLKPLPPGVKLHSFRPQGGKPARFGRVHDLWRRGWVELVGSHPVLVDQALQFPNGRNDDCLDAVCAGIEHVLKGRPVT